MGDQRVAVVEPKQKIFRAPRERGDPPPREALAKAEGEWKTDVAPPQFDLFDAGSDHRRLKAAPDGLDLGQFRHCDGPE